MTISRRTLMGSTLLAAAPLALPLLARAQDATPDAMSSPEAAPRNMPGYGIIRVRTVASPELNQAVFPDVMYRFLPQTAAVPGYFGYVFATKNDDAATSLTMTLLSDEAASNAADEVAKAYVAGLDPRLTPETPLAEQGPIRVFQLTDRPALEIPPYLTSCSFTFRHRTNAADTDVEELVAAVNESLVPLLMKMDGFVLYGWTRVSDGRISYNIWETPEQLAAGDAAVAEWVKQHPISTQEGATEVYAGTIGYSDILGTA